MIKDIMFADKYEKGGEEKTAWRKVGTLFVKDDGKMSMKIDMVPLNTDGWFQVFDQKPRDESPKEETTKDPF